MDFPNGMSGPSSLWQEARNADGRVYYYNTQTRETQWTKPSDMMTPAERALSNQPWKEYTADGGRKYWYNTETKQSSWEMPQAYRDATSQNTMTQPPSQNFVAGGAPSFSTPAQLAGADESGGQERPQNYSSGEVNGHRAFVSSSIEPDYATYEEAEAAFLKLLRRSGVQPDWSWEEAVRSIIKDPQYRSIKDPRDRKAAFEKYVVEVRAQEKDRARERLAKLRSEFTTMLKRHPEIKHYTRWKTARSIIEGESTFRSTSDETERRQLFEEYIIELKKANADNQKRSRESALNELVSILEGMNLEPYTRWSEVREAVQSNERFQIDDKFRTLSKSDILGAFESHIKALERASNDKRQQHKLTKSRRERQNRDKFMRYLHELRSSSKIKVGTKWKQIYPLVCEDERYQALLGQPGSSPIELFWDVVEEEERGMRGQKNTIVDILEDKRFIITSKTTLEEFLDVLKGNSRVARTDPEVLAIIFERIREKAIRRSEDDKYAQRDAIGALRSRIKHLNPPIQISSTWESIKPRIEKFAEYQALPTDDLRRTAFDKAIQRLKDKADDPDRDRTRYRSSDVPPRSAGYRDRESTRDGRNGYSSSRRGRDSRGDHSPEPDAYEDDRRKAQADRERQYRKASTTGLSPPPRSARSERGDRDYRDKDRSSRHGDEKYDRHRRDREDDRGYRGGRGGTRDELDYGDGRLGAGERDKRRRVRSGSEASTGRDSKRSRRSDRSPTSRRRRASPTPPPAKIVEPVKEEPVLHSGSEEGEIEED